MTSDYIIDIVIIIILFDYTISQIDNQIRNINYFDLINTNDNDDIEKFYYGNEFHQSQFYFNLIDNNRQSKLREERSFHMFDNLLYDMKLKSFDKETLDIRTKLLENFTSIFDNYAHSYTNDSYIKSMDCEYATALVNVKKIISINDNTSYYQFNYLIDENNCNSNISIKGGSSFDVYATTINTVVSCLQHSSLSSTYHIKCIISSDHIDRRNDLNQSYVCINITSLLFGMHFDSFNEIRKTFIRQFYRILDNNKQYCIYNNLIDQRVRYLNSDDISYWFYTGEWIDSHSNQIDSYYIYNYNSTRNLTIDNMFKNLSSNFEDDNQRRFNGSYQLISLNKTLHESKQFHIKYYHPNTSYLTKPWNITRLKDVNNRLCFIGSSHMRGFFDGIAEYLYGGHINDHISVIHNYRKIENLEYIDSKFVVESRFIIHNSAYLNNTCNNINKLKLVNVNYTIVFQTGAWDVAHLPLAHIFRDKYIGKVLIETITNILTGVIPCGNLNHFIWLTSVPVPLCLLNNNTYCVRQSGYRNNAAISAVNNYFLKNLMQVKPLDGIRFSIIDAYNIIKPRLILDIVNEVVCNWHYMCRYAIQPKLLSSYPLLLHTPGGDAVISTLFLAILNI